MEEIPEMFLGYLKSYSVANDIACCAKLWHREWIKECGQCCTSTFAQDGVEPGVKNWTEAYFSDHETWYFRTSPHHLHHMDWRSKWKIFQAKLHIFPSTRSIAYSIFAQGRHDIILCFSNKNLLILKQQYGIIYNFAWWGCRNTAIQLKKQARLYSEGRLTAEHSLREPIGKGLSIKHRYSFTE